MLITNVLALLISLNTDISRFQVKAEGIEALLGKIFLRRCLRQTYAPMAGDNQTNCARKTGKYNGLKSLISVIVADRMPSQWLGETSPIATMTLTLASIIRIIQPQMIHVNTRSSFTFGDSSTASIAAECSPRGNWPLAIFYHKVHKGHEE